MHRTPTIIHANWAQLLVAFDTLRLWHVMLVAPVGRLLRLAADNAENFRHRPLGCISQIASPTIPHTTAAVGVVRRRHCQMPPTRSGSGGSLADPDDGFCTGAAYVDIVKSLLVGAPSRALGCQSEFNSKCLHQPRRPRIAQRRTQLITNRQQSNQEDLMKEMQPYRQRGTKLATSQEPMIEQKPANRRPQCASTVKSITTWSEHLSKLDFLAPANNCITHGQFGWPLHGAWCRAHSSPRRGHDRNTNPQRAKPRTRRPHLCRAYHPQHPSTAWMSSEHDNKHDKDGGRGSVASLAVDSCCDHDHDAATNGHGHQRAVQRPSKLPWVMQLFAGAEVELRQVFGPCW